MAFPENVKNLVRDPKVHAALVALGVAVAAYFHFACASTAQLSPAVVHGIDVAQCELNHVRSLVPQIETADAVVAAARAGDYDRAVNLLINLGMNPNEVKAVADAFVDCVHPAPAAPVPAPTTT